MIAIALLSAILLLIVTMALPETVGRCVYLLIRSMTKR